MPLVQALLLMSYWDDTSHNLEEPSHWLALAWKVALNASLFKASAEKSNQARKLWWCFHIRDKLISLNLRKSPHIKCLNFDVELLTIDDFHTEVYDVKVLLALPDSVPLLLSDSQKMMFMTFLQMTQLCICVHHVLEDLYEDTWNSTAGCQYNLGPCRSLGRPVSNTAYDLCGIGSKTCLQRLAAIRRSHLFAIQRQLKLSVSFSKRTSKFYISLRLALYCTL